MKRFWQRITKYPSKLFLVILLLIVSATCVSGAGIIVMNKLFERPGLSCKEAEDIPGCNVMTDQEREALVADSQSLFSLHLPVIYNYNMPESEINKKEGTSVSVGLYFDIEDGEKINTYTKNVSTAEVIQGSFSTMPVLLYKGVGLVVEQTTAVNTGYYVEENYVNKKFSEVAGSPEQNNVVLNYPAAEQLGVAIGDVLTMSDDIKLTVVDIRSREVYSEEYEAYHQYIETPEIYMYSDTYEAIQFIGTVTFSEIPNDAFVSVPDDKNETTEKVNKVGVPEWMSAGENSYMRFKLGSDGVYYMITGKYTDPNISTPKKAYVNIIYKDEATAKRELAEMMKLVKE